MIFRFNIAQLERERSDALASLLDKLQRDNKSEIDVCNVEFPKRFLIKLDSGREMMVTWDAEKKVFAEPEPEPEHGTIEVDLSGRPPEPKPEPEPEKDFGIDPIKLARLKYDLVTTFLTLSVEKEIIFNREYARLWGEHK